MVGAGVSSLVKRCGRPVCAARAAALRTISSANEPFVMAYRIRSATHRDAHTIATLGGALGYAGGEQGTAARLAMLLDRGDHAVLVAEDDSGAIAGWVHAFVALRLASEPFVEVGGLVVDEWCRRRGIGRRLVAAVVEWAARRSYGRVRVRVNARREEARAFYAGIGFEPAKYQNVYERRVRDGEDSFLYYT